MTHVSSLLLAFCLCLLLLGSLPAVSSAANSSAETAYQKTADQCHLLLRSPSLGGQREDWLKEIHELERIYRQEPQGHTASACLHLNARMRQAMYQHFHQPADLDQAAALFNNVVTLFPKSNEAAESLFALAQMEQSKGNLRGAAKTYYKLTHDYPFSSRKAQAEEQLRQLTIIAESLASRKEGRKPAVQPIPAFKPAMVPVLPAPQPLVSLPQPTPTLTHKAQEKIILPLPAAASTAAFNPATAMQPVPHATVTLPLIKAEEKKPQEKSSPPAEAVSKPAAKPAPPKKEEPSLLSKLLHPDFSFSLFGSDEEEKKKEATKPAAPSLPIVNPPPSSPVSKPESLKPAIVLAAPVEEKTAPPVLPPLLKAAEEPTAKIVVSELKIAPEPDKAAAKAVAPVLPIANKSQAEQAPHSAAPPVKELAPAEPAKPAVAELQPLQHWSSDTYNRVVVSASAPAAYQTMLPEKGNRQLRLEFKPSHVPAALRAPIEVNKGLIKRIWAEQSDEHTVRVSVDLTEDVESKIFSLSDPFRVVVDLRKATEAAAVRSTAATDSPKELTTQEKKARAAEVQEQIKAEAKEQSKVIPKAAAKQSLTLAQQLGLGIRRIMIDPGHGGKDAGASGFGLEEKNIVLDVAKRVRELLKKEQYEVLLTRERDAFIPLEERTAIANTKGADLFLSIHVNAHPTASVKGVETYYLNLATNPEAMRVAALENATSSHSMSEMEDILTSLMQNSKINESSLLAEFIQTSMSDGLRRYKVKNLGVKKAPFYVLIGAQMPAALAEISFISNKDEAALLKNEQYLQAIAKRIAIGVAAYVEHRHSKATATTPPEVLPAK